MRKLIFKRRVVHPNMSNIETFAKFQPNKGIENVGVDKQNIQVRHVKCHNKHYFKKYKDLSRYTLYVFCPKIKKMFTLFS